MEGVFGNSFSTLMKSGSGADLVLKGCELICNNYAKVLDEQEEKLGEVADWYTFNAVLSACRAVVAVGCLVPGAGGATTKDINDVLGSPHMCGAWETVAFAISESEVWSAMRDSCVKFDTASEEAGPAMQKYLADFENLRGKPAELLMSAAATSALEILPRWTTSLRNGAVAPLTKCLLDACKAVFVEKDISIDVAKKALLVCDATSGATDDAELRDITERAQKRIDTFSDHQAEQDLVVLVALWVEVSGGGGAGLANMCCV